MFGEALTGSEAAAFGIVTRVVPVDNARTRYERGDTAPLYWADPRYMNVQGFGLCHVVGFDGIDLEPSGADQVIRLAIEMTAPLMGFQTALTDADTEAIRISDQT